MLAGSFMKIFGTFCALLLPLAAYAQQDQSQLIQEAVLVQSVSIGRASSATPGAVPVNAELRNISRKSIYAFDIECTSTYSDGSTRAAKAGVDLLANYVFELKDPALTPRPNMLLRPGESYASGASAPLGKDGAPPVGGSCAITMLTFDDRTALGDHNAIQKVAKGRSFLYTQYAGVVSDLKSVVDTSDPIQAMEKRRDELLKPAPGDPDVSGPNGRLSPNSGRAQWFEILVRGNGGNSMETRRTMIRTAINDYQRYVDVLKLHTILQEERR
jgi:hypothetical protein